MIDFRYLIKDVIGVAGYESRIQDKDKSQEQRIDL